MIEVTLLGTGSPIPDPNRAGPSTLVRAGGQALLVDCGRGVLQRAAAVGVGAAGLSALLLTHLHSDHIADLGDVLITRWISTFTPDPAPLPIIGPPGTAEAVAATLNAFRRVFALEPFRVRIDLAEGVAVDRDTLSLRVLRRQGTGAWLARSELWGRAWRRWMERVRGSDGRGGQ